MWSGAGLDFGNKYCVVGIPQSRSISVLLDQASNRLIPTMAGYSEKRRVFGTLAQQEILQNLEGTITQLKRLVCLKYDSEERKSIEKMVNFELFKLNDGFTGIKLSNNGDNIFLPAQIIAYLLKSLMKITQSSQQAVAAFSITVSPWWTQAHRQTIIDACKIAKINLITLINSTTAAAVGYAMDHRSKLPKSNENPIPIAFIDIGDSSMNVAIAYLKEDNVRISSFAYDEHFGGSNFTEKLLDYLIEETKKKYKIDPRENKRMLHRFTESVEKLKKNLSVNSSMQFEVIGIKGDTDVRFIVKREEFEAQIQDLLSRLENPIQKALESSNLKKEDLKGCELLGGCSRIPIVKAEIQKILKKEPEQAVNIDECFATGAGYISAILNPNMQVPMTVTDVTPHNVTANWTDKEGSKVCEIYKQFSQIPSTKLVPLNINEETKIKFISNNEEICSVTIKPPSESNEIFIRVRMSQSSTFEVIEAFYKQNPDPKTNPKGETKVDINVQYQSILSDSEIARFSQIENEFSSKDDYENSIDETRNELEGFLFKVERGIEQEYKESFNPNDFPHIKEEIAKIRNWFDEHEFERLDLKEYKNRLENLKSVALPGIKRFELWKSIKENSQSLHERSVAMLERVLSSKTPKDKKQDFEARTRKYISNLEELIKQSEQKKPYEDPPFVYNEKEKEFSILNDEGDLCIRESEKQGGYRCYIA